MSTSRLGLYIHWPFCLSKCPYCDFNSHVQRRIDTEQWQKAFLTEMQYFASLTRGRVLESIFFGGGTPSLMSPDLVATLIHQASNYWQLASEAEITLEANPNSVEIGKLKDFKTAGVNRVSIGIQALHNESLKFLGRGHNREEALQALKTAARVFDRYSFDLIYARPTQTILAWQQELEEALSYAQGHLSLYQLTIEPGTAFHTLHQRQAFDLLTEEESTLLYEITQERLTQANMPSYEVSNYALLGSECQHNLIYWRYEDFIGIGPGAHGRLTLEGQKKAFKCLKAPEKWLHMVAEKGKGIDETFIIEQTDKVTEMLMMGLRLAEGISLQRFKSEIGKNLDEILDSSKLQRLIEGGFLKLTGHALMATPQGRQRLNAVLAVLL